MGFTGFEVSRAFDDWCSIKATDGSARIGFQKVPEGKIVKNRVHIDFVAKDEEATEREIEAMGATRRWVSEDPRRSVRRPRRSGGQRVLHRSRRVAAPTR
jgi:hypothetical protein